MRCKTCDYPLWNLKTRACPECGASFRPTDFEFVANSVAFCCPHCDQPYYGTGECGYLEPPEFDCVACGNHVDMDAMILRPTEGVKEEHTRPGVMPWFEREERGRVKAWLATVWMSMVEPSVLMRGVTESSPIGAAWWYAIVTNVILIFGRFLPVVCLAIPLVFIAPSSGGGGGSPGWLAIAAGAAAGSAIGIVGSVLFLVLGLGLWGLVIHGVLRLGDPIAGGLGRTYQAVCYSSGASAICVVPCISDFGLIWWVVSAVFMVREGQRVGGLRATLAVLAFPIAVVVVVIMIYAVVVGSFIGAATSSATGAAATATQQAEALAIGQRTAAYRLDHDGVFPVHGLQIVAGGGGGTGIFVSGVDATAPEDVPTESGTLRDFQTLGPNRQQAEADRAAAALPEGVVAHRVGDVVFTWHGIDPEAPDPGLWLFVMSPNGDPFAVLTGGTVAGRVDGTAQAIAAGAMPDALLEQNVLRATHGLSPLPDLATVTHEQPAVAR